QGTAHVELRQIRSNDREQVQDPSDFGSGALSLVKSVDCHFIVHGQKFLLPRSVLLVDLCVPPMRPHHRLTAAFISTWTSPLRWPAPSIAVHSRRILAARR